MKAIINGWEIEHTVAGEGPPVLSIHGGFGGPMSRFAERARYFAMAVGDGFRLIEYDRRNCGQSEIREASYTQDDLAEEAVGVLNQLEIGRAIIVGDSMGGTIAQSFALRHPDRVAALALVETSAHMTDAPFYGPLTGLMTMAESEGADAVFERRRRSIYEPQLPPNLAALPDERQEAMRATYASYRETLRNVEEAVVKLVAAGELCNWRAHAGFDTRSALGELGRHRTLVLHGDSDATVPTPHGRELAASIPGARLALIAGGQHGIFAWLEARVALQTWLADVTAGI